jgi:hypothetical protein
LVFEDWVALANRHFANGRRTEARQGRAKPAAARRERASVLDGTEYVAHLVHDDAAVNGVIDERSCT